LDKGSGLVLDMPNNLQVYFWPSLYSYNLS